MACQRGVAATAEQLVEASVNANPNPRNVKATPANPPGVGDLMQD